MNPFTWLYEFISDRQIRMTHKFSVTIITIFVIILIDNHLGFSYHLSTSYKLDELQKVDRILTDKLSDSVSKNYALFQRERIMNRESIISYIFFRRSSWAAWNSKNANTINPAAIPNWRDSNIKESLLFYVTASGLIYFAGFVMFLFVIFSKSSNLSWSVKLSSTITIIAVFALVGSLFQKLLTLIPIIKSNPDNNHVLNFVLQLVFLFGIVVPLIVRSENRKRKKALY